MYVEVVLLGTGGSVPSKDRNFPSVLVSYQGERFLFDCGEGTQRQMVMAEESVNVNAVFLTHRHADHVLGLPGLLSTLHLWGRERPLYVFAPEVKFTERLVRIAGRTGYPVEVKEAKGVVWEGKVKVWAFPVKHGVPTVGYVVDEGDVVKADKEKLRELGLERDRRVGELKGGKV